MRIDDDREGSLRAIDLGDVRICHASLGRHRMVQETASRALSANPALKFFLQEEGTARLTQNGRTLEVREGEWCAMRKDLPYVLASDGYSRQLSITLPCELVGAPRPGFAWWGTPRSFLRGPGKALHASAAGAIRQHGGDGAHIAQRLDLLLRAAGPEAAQDVREARRLAAAEYIERNLTEPDLNVQSIAVALGCSTRALHKLFKGEARTIARQIWERRLERSRSRLIDPALGEQSITDIAHYCGFCDSQHFSRAFKRRFGITPRECRRTMVYQPSRPAGAMASQAASSIRSLG
ncbi:MAG TPA: helix-turn-helix domain-containing protein [Croceibacterium sp.]|nr:helix-turn-helix domain-containing protein [Croceibacterium sp.]